MKLNTAIQASFHIKMIVIYLDSIIHNITVMSTQKKIPKYNETVLYPENIEKTKLILKK